jgi:hypothetical protein
MTGFEAVRDSIVALIAAAVQVETPVYNRIRFGADEAFVKNTFFSSAQGGRLHFWAVVPASADSYVTSRYPANHEHSTYAYDCHAFFAVKDGDSSEILYTAEVLAVIAGFRANKKLNNTVIDSGPPTWAENDFRMFMNVLCHHGRLAIKAWEQTEP